MKFHNNMWTRFQDCCFTKLHQILAPHFTQSFGPHCKNRVPVSTGTLRQPKQRMQDADIKSKGHLSNIEDIMRVAQLSLFLTFTGK